MACGCGLMSAFQRQFYIDSDCFGHRAVFVIRSSEVVRFSEVLNTLRSSMINSIGALMVVHFTEVVHFWEDPLREVSL